MKKTIAVYALAAAAFAAGSVYGQEVSGCGTLNNAFGPYDYVDSYAHAKELAMVEAFHFTSQVEALVAGQSSSVVADLDYTLRAFPNHHRALSALSRYALKGGRDWPNMSIQSADCYFERAKIFRPGDPAVHLIYGNYLNKRGDIPKAKLEYEAAVALAPDSADVAYNSALFFLDIGSTERAKDLASVAYSKNYPLDGLRKRLQAKLSADEASSK